MATQYVSAYATSTTPNSDTTTRAYAQVDVSGASVTTGMLLSYDGTLSTSQLAACLREIGRRLGLPGF